jgi:hypothetical protein
MRRARNSSGGIRHESAAIRVRGSSGRIAEDGIAAEIVVDVDVSTAEAAETAGAEGLTGAGAETGGRTADITADTAMRHSAGRN